MASSSLDRLTLEDEVEDLEVPGEGEQQEEGVDLALCLVGRFLMSRPIRVHMMMERMAGVWLPGKQVTIKEIEGGRSLFQFYHKVDVQRILKGGPWSFDGHILILGPIQAGEDPQQVELYKVPFWVQIHNVPIGFMTEKVGQHLANFIWEFIEYDAKNNSNFLKTFMRIRVLIDVRLPLKRLKGIKKPGG